MLLSASLLSVLLAGVGCQDSATAPTGEFQKEADPPLNCPVSHRARRGDKVIMEYVGFLADQTQFDSGKSEFVLGKNFFIFISKIMLKVIMVLIEPWCRCIGAPSLLELSPPPPPKQNKIGDFFGAS